MSFYADLHVHSKYSRACSKDCDLEHLTWWARRKGISLVGTGDFTHPAWNEHLHEMLVPAEPGLFRLREDVAARVDRTVPGSCAGPVRFMLSVEISTIYKRDEATRKVHHLVYLPDLDSVTRFNRALGRIGNLGSDGRPILGLDSRDLLEITLEASPDGYLVPAHVWTPWFSALGSKSGFDAIEDCYADLAGHIFALETGLSSDPPMNWRVSSLDSYRLVSNSDAHSPPMLGREASVFTTGLDYFAVRDALRTGDGYAGSLEFFPEEGKYHLDGHRKCDVRCEPAQTREHGGRCPACGRPLTVGVLHRVEALADRPEGGPRPETAVPFQNLVPLPEITGEVLGVGSKSKRVAGQVSDLVARLGPELSILTDVPIADVERAGGPLLAEAVARLRRGEVIRDAGYDGEYGRIKLFHPDELSRPSRGTALFDLDVAERVVEPAGRQPAATPGAVPTAAPATGPEPGVRTGGPGGAAEPLLTGMEQVGAGLLDRLDPDQRAAAASAAGPLLIVAGPGTGKTRTLTHRIAHLVRDRGVAPERCLAITFTRRAADELGERLDALVPEHRGSVLVSTFHGLGLRILREVGERAGLTADFRVADETERLALLTEVTGSPAAARRALAAVSRHRRSPAGPDAAPSAAAAETAETAARYTKALRARDLVDFDDLVTLPVALLTEHADLAERYRRRWEWVSVDEYQDTDETQYRLLRLLVPPDGNLCAIGDPDQAIYRFRGADVGFFLRFGTDYPAATRVSLTRNYRSTPAIVAAAVQAIAPGTLVPDRVLEPMRRDPRAIRVGVHQAPTDQAEAEFVARTVDQLLGGSSFHSLDSGRVDGRGGTTGVASSFSDIAVLYRTDAQARAVTDALTRAGMPFQKRSHDRLADRPGVRAILAELRFAERPGTLDGPPTPADAGPVLDRVRRIARALVGRLPTYAANADEQTAELHAAVELLAPLAEGCDTDTARFAAELALGAEVDTWDPRADRISLLTLHAAKGLEFPVVFVVGCADGLLPLRLPGREPDEASVAEERRLLFVGMTRAQSYLCLSHARQSTRMGTTREAAPSAFLAAIDQSLCERLGESAPRRPRATQLRLI